MSIVLTTHSLLPGPAQDVSVDNVDFPVVWQYANKTKDAQPNAKAFNQMEATTLELLKFNVYISPSLYAQYYFELRNFYESQFGTSFPVKPLDQQQATRLEMLTAVSQDELRGRVTPSSKSDYHVKGLSRAVLS